MTFFDALFAVVGFLGSPIMVLVYTIVAASFVLGTSIWATEEGYGWVWLVTILVCLFIILPALWVSGTYVVSNVWGVE
jgi:hypothetical protein